MTDSLLPMCRSLRVGCWLVALFVLGCQPGDDGPANVLLVSIDALRADRLGCYGYELETSPFLDELASTGVRFSGAFVNTHGTTTSHTTMLSGLYQQSHRVDFVEHTRIPPEVALVQETLRAAGYTTVAVTDGGNAGARFGFDAGFESFDDRGGGVEKGSRRLLQAIAEVPAGEPVFAFFHTYEVHSPYTPPDEYLRRFTAATPAFEPTSGFLLEHAHSARSLPPADLAFVSASYDAGIRYTDDVLRSLFAELEASGFLARALVIVTADHGEELGDHGGFLHRDLLYDELLHVPLIVTGRGVPRGIVEQRLVSSVDIVPTVLRFAGLTAPESLPGRDLLAPLPERPVFSQYGSRRYSIRTAEWKLIETTEPLGIELYDLTADPGEQLDLAQQRPQEVARLREQLRSWREAQLPVAGVARPAELGPTELEQLRRLGYVAE